MNESKIKLPEQLEKLFEDAHKSLPEKIQNISCSVKEALTLNDFNIQEKAMVASYQHHGFVNCLFAERRLLKKMEEASKEIEEEYVEKFGKAGIPKFKIAAEIQKSDQIAKIKTAINDQREVVKYLEDICRIMSQHGFSIKNSTDLMKLSS